MIVVLFSFRERRDRCNMDMNVSHCSLLFFVLKHEKGYQKLLHTPHAKMLKYNEAAGQQTLKCMQCFFLFSPLYHGLSATTVTMPPHLKKKYYDSSTHLMNRLPQRWHSNTVLTIEICMIWFNTVWGKKNVPSGKKST